MILMFEKHFLKKFWNEGRPNTVLLDIKMRRGGFTASFLIILNL
jgi:hypothetical protein